MFKNNQNQTPMTFLREFILKIFFRKSPQHIDADYHKILSAHSTYYKNLNTELKKEFRLRLYHLLNVLGFSSAKIPEITREMRAVIGCAIIEITFGLKNYLPDRFTKIIVMPRRYMYPGYGQPFLGHIDYIHETIYFSWQDVKHGYLIPDDAVNVALHEMAHVLEVENSFNALFSNFFSRVSWHDWAEIAFQKMQIIRAKQNYFLKSYGGINMKEMFAVCVETFFEQPKEFKRNLPELYDALVELLRQDPTIKGSPLLDR